MKKFLASAIVALCTVTMLFSGTVRDNQNFTAEVNFDSGCIWKIKGVTVNVTAAQLNYLTAGGLPVSLLAIASNKMIIGDATGAGSEVAVSGDISMSNLGAFTVDEINSIAVATVTAGAALGATSAQNTDVWGSSGVTTSTVAAVATAAIQTKTVAGGNLAEYRVLRVWLGDTSMGVASTNNITSLVLSGGAAVETKTAEADYIYLTGADGTASAAVTGQTAIDKYIMVEDGSSVSATKITFEP